MRCQQDTPGAAERRQGLTRSAVYREITLPRLTRDEAKRWLDLVRRDSEEPGSNYWYNSLLNHDPNASASGKLFTFRKRFPIPQSERNVNPALTQNAGY